MGSCYAGRQSPSVGGGGNAMKKQSRGWWSVAVSAALLAPTLAPRPAAAGPFSYVNAADNQKNQAQQEQEHRQAEERDRQQREQQERSRQEREQRSRQEQERRA